MKVGRLFLFALVCVGTAALRADPVAASSPSTFEIFCGHPYFDEISTDFMDPDTWASVIAETQPRTAGYYANRIDDDPDIPGEADCMPTLPRELLESYADDALPRLEALNFVDPRPNSLGPVVMGRHGWPVVRLYADADTDSYANTLAPCNGRRVVPHYLSFLRINPAFFSSASGPLRYRMLAHELVHVVQNAQPLWLQAAGCPPPDWLAEGMADALSVDLMEAYGLRYRPPLSVHGSRSIYGLRRYDRALTWHSDQAVGTYGYKLLPQYRTSSFWAHLAERYFDGDYAFLGQWVKASARAAGGDDWLAWLDQRLRADDGGVDHPLYLVFPDFLAHYAAWGEKKYRNIGDRQWMAESFRCETITLSPRQPKRGLHLELEPISGQCVRVVVGGLEPGQVVRVAFMAYETDLAALDDLHLTASKLGARSLSFGGEFHCYDTVSESDAKEPLCVTKPFMGTRGEPAEVTETAAGNFAKTWLTDQQEAAGTSFENRYFVVHSPVEPRDARHANDSRQEVRIAIALETSTLETEIQGKAKQADADVNALTNTEPIPMRGSTGGVGGGSAEAGGDPDGMSRLPFLIDMGRGGGAREATGSGLRTVTLTAAEVTHALGSEQLEPTLMLNLMLAEPVPFGAIGSYEARVVGNLVGGRAGAMPSLANPAAMLAGQLLNVGAEPSGTIEVVEFSDDLLHLRLSGTYCRASNRTRSGACRRPERFSGETFKPFGWAYDGAQAFHSIDTPGIAEYREYLTRVLAERMPGVFTEWRRKPGEDEETGGPGGGPGSVVSADTPCNCSCEEFTRFRELTQELKQAREGGVMPSNALLSQLGCAVPCAREWARCK